MKRRMNGYLLAGLIVTGLMAALILVGLVWTPYDPAALLAGPKLEGPSLAHWLGTDSFGRDIFSRVLQGAGTTFLIALSTVAIGAVCGTAAGALTGYFGGVVDEVLMRLNDALTAFPSILLALVLISILGPGNKYNVVIALGIVFIPSFARVTRTAFAALRDVNYVKSARLMGASSGRILVRQILPNTTQVLLPAINADDDYKSVFAEIRSVFAPAPVQTQDGSFKLGIWVRDNVQGLGTITFLTKNNRFAALGHGIHDIDTSTLLTIKRGTLYRTSIQKVQKGSKGNPGTMEGIIVYNRFHRLGVIEKNTDAGIYGELNSDRSWIGEEVPIQVAKKEEIKTGEARIRCYIDGEVKEYTICITQIDKESDQVNKGMVIQVTDTELLEKTGGIIQGMSGSPIIQNGKLIGAVTHVFVQDSTKGYGIFIENMLKEEES